MQLLSKTETVLMWIKPPFFSFSLLPAELWMTRDFRLFSPLRLWIGFCQMYWCFSLDIYSRALHVLHSCKNSLQKLEVPRTFVGCWHKESVCYSLLLILMCIPREHNNSIYLKRIFCSPVPVNTFHNKDNKDVCHTPCWCSIPWRPFIIIPRSPW